LWLTEGDIDHIIALDTELMRCDAWGSILALATNRCRGLLSLCISDTAKQMLLSTAGFIPLLINGLLLDPEHPRKDTDEAIKTAVQRDFAECVQQISLFPAGRAALTADSAVVDVLDVLVDKAWSEEAKDCARGALMQLTDRHHEAVAEVDLDARHIMMSCACVAPALCLIGFGIHCCVQVIDDCCAALLLLGIDQWDVQEVVKKIVAELVSAHAAHHYMHL
jgi:hypothetical protein